MYANVPLYGGVPNGRGGYYNTSHHPPKNQNKNLRHSRKGRNLLRRRHFYPTPILTALGGECHRNDDEGWLIIFCIHTTGLPRSPRSLAMTKSHQQKIPLSGELLLLIHRIKEISICLGQSQFIQQKFHCFQRSHWIYNATQHIHLA